MNHKLTNIFFWGIISAAFIGPGTITTAASAGAGFGYSLLWALVFSTVACIVLQEASARLRLATGNNLGEVLRAYFGQKKRGTAIVLLLLGSIIFGCAAYETGNILGAVAGGMLMFNISPVVYTLVIGSAAGLLLWFGSTRLIAQIMGVMVALMGICFLGTAFILQPPIDEILSGSLIPSFPKNSEIIILGLIGTTVVPYNLFLGSGLAHKQSLSEMRWSLSLAIILGGIVSAAVLVVGASISGTFSFERLAGTLQLQLGDWAVYLLGFGLLGAGFSSALTAPLAAAITAKSLGSEADPKWKSTGAAYRVVWGAVLLTGILFGISNVQPVPAIILAQALNGIILPVVAIFLLLMANNARLLDNNHINSTGYNLLMSAVVFVTILLGVRNVIKAVVRVSDVKGIGEEWMIGLAVMISLGCLWPMYRAIKRLRKSF
jgi:Mn2+/Fe2+ NRAMP family transporter